MKTNRKAYSNEKELAYRDDIEVWEDITSIFTPNITSSYTMGTATGNFSYPMKIKVTYETKRITTDGVVKLMGLNTAVLILTQYPSVPYYHKTDNIYLYAGGGEFKGLLDIYSIHPTLSLLVTLRTQITPSLAAEDIPKITKIERVVL